jgi:hypothetical protein
LGISAILRRVYNIAFTFELNHDPTRSVFLASMGRSGSTWVKDIINYNKDYRYIHEPFHPYRNRLVKHFHYHQYIDPLDSSSDFYKPVEAILSGRIRNVWTDSDNATLFSKKRLVKAIRANLLLKWIHVNFPEVPIILLFRHPCAVANSWLKLFWGTEESGTRTDLEGCLSQERLLGDFLNPFRSYIKEARTPFEKHIFLWCILYYVPLTQFQNGEVHLAFYENFCAHPQEEIRRLMTFLNADFDESVLTQLGHASSVSREDSPINIGASLLDDWRRHITSYQATRSVEILKLFGLDRIYSQDSLPNTEGAYQFLKKDLVSGPS